MIKSGIEFIDGKPFISVNGELHYPLAYTTYFDECGEYDDFISKGYKMFFVNASFTDKPINNLTGFTPFRKGIFEADTPDYSEFDFYVKHILKKCPDALIFPRINAAMPKKWLDAHPYETVDTPKGGAREALSSDLYLRDGSELLRILIEHIRSQPFADRITGYQICGGITQEWMHHDLFGSFSDMSLEKFRKWMQEKYGIENAEVPTKEMFTKGVVNDATRRYIEFSNAMAAEAINHFAKKLKEFTDNEQIVGAFYGYSAFVGNNLYGLHGLHNIIDSPYIDFFSSPCAYDNARELGIDWGDMIPVDSLKIHNKLAFIECDIRTHLTRRMQDSRPGEYSIDAYGLTDSNGNRTVWKGPENEELSLSAIRKTFAHQITKASGIWWFDMWGGWYHSEKIMDDIQAMKIIADTSKIKKRSDYPSAEAAIFIDEGAYANIPYSNALDRTVVSVRTAMSFTGIPYDMYLTEDFERVAEKYRSVIFTAPLPSESGIKAVELCKKMNIPFLTITEEKLNFTTDELMSFLTENGIHCYNSEGNVIYADNGYIAVHSIKDGEAEIKLPAEYTVKPLFNEDFTQCTTDTITINLKKYETAAFELIKE